MSVVELALADGQGIVYVSPGHVRRLEIASTDVTMVVFDKDDCVLVKGEIDQVAFTLFPDCIR